MPAAPATPRDEKSDRRRKHSPPVAHASASATGYVPTVIDDEQKSSVPAGIDWLFVVQPLPVKLILVVKPASSHSDDASQNHILVSAGTVHSGAEETSIDEVHGMTVPAAIDW